MGAKKRAAGRNRPPDGFGLRPASGAFCRVGKGKGGFLGVLLPVDINGGKADDSTAKAKEELYQRNGIELDMDAALEEVAADISGEVLNDKNAMEYIGAKNAEVATGINRWLGKILNKLRGKPSAEEAYNRLSESQKALLDGMEGRTEAEEARRREKQMLIPMGTTFQTMFC